MYGSEIMSECWLLLAFCLALHLTKHFRILHGRLFFSGKGWAFVPFCPSVLTSSVWLLCICLSQSPEAPVQNQGSMALGPVALQ